MERYKANQKIDEGLRIFLQVLNGVNFLQEKPARNITLTATLEQNALEAITRRPVTPGSGTAAFDAKLVWECDRYYVKMAKSKNIPIKVECFEMLPGGKRCPIGHVVIALRSIPMVPLARTNMIKPRWYRLVGIASERWRNRKPELHIKVMITEPQYDGSDIQTPEDTGNDEIPEPAQHTTIYANPASEQLEGDAELIAERGLLQIGHRDEDTDLFLLAIFLKCGRHLDRLAPGADTLCLRYQLCGEVYSVYAERMEPGSAVFSVKETISIRIRSSLAALGNYLQDALKIALDVLPECDPLVMRLAPGQPSPVRVLGKTTIDCVGFVQETSLDEFQRKYSTNNQTMEAARSFTIHPTDDGEGHHGASAEEHLVPTLECKFALRFLANDRRPANAPGRPGETDEPNAEEQEDTESNPKGGKVPSSTEHGTDLDEVETSPRPARYLPENSKKPTTPRMEDAASVLEKVDIESILLTADADLRDIRRTFAFNVRVGLIKFTASPSPGLWQLTLQHPRADTPFTRHTLELLPDAVHPERIDFGDIMLKLLFSTLPERVLEVIGSEPSKLTLNGPHGMHALARLDNASLLVGTRERQPFGVVVMVNGSTGEKVAIATVGCTLEEVGLNYNSQLPEAADDEQPKIAATSACCHSRANPAARPIGPFDESVAYQLLEEQKVWMREQRDQFFAELQEKERTHLRAVTHDWEVQRAAKEKHLADRMAHVNAMAASLDEARRRLDDRDHGGAATRVTQLERQFREQLEAIRTKALRLEREAEGQIEATRKQCRELQDQLGALSLDQQHLLDVNVRLQAQLDEECGLRERDASELQQKLEEVSESKLHYKEQWAKMTRRVHQLEQELAVARTPYYQPTRREHRPKGDHRRGGEGSQMSVVSGVQRHGAGDCSSCNIHKPPDGCQ